MIFMSIDHSLLSNIAVEIVVKDSRWENVFPLQDLQAGAVQLFHCLLSRIQTTKSSETTNLSTTPIEVSLALMNDRDIQHLNKMYRGYDKPTNVLSFSLLEASDKVQAGRLPCPSLLPGQPLLLGDIALSIDTLIKEATAQRKSFHDHCLHMLGHGFLHLLGYDHIDDKDAEVMEALEIAALRDLGIANPYEENDKEIDHDEAIDEEIVNP
jgi:probable rRNA maturation factor